MARPRVRFPSPAPISRRIASWGWDYLVILAWLAVVFLIVGLPQLLGLIDPSAIWEDQVTADIAISVLTVLPYFLYLTLTEIGSRHATWGKRRAGIEVASPDGAAPATTGVVVRNLLKVLPWQLGHMGTSRLIVTETSTFGLWLNVASMVILAAIVVPIIFRRPGIHDLLGRTRVISAPD